MRPSLWLAPLALLSLSPSAFAGIGTTFYFGGENSSWGGFPGGAYPSLDFTFDRFILQIHALEFLDELTDDSLYLGANGYMALVNLDIDGKLQGVVQPGASLDIVDDPFGIGIAALARVGAEKSGRMGIGLYVVPAFGFTIIDEDVDLLLGGTLQVSAWANTGKR